MEMNIPFDLVRNKENITTLQTCPFHFDPSVTDPYCSEKTILSSFIEKVLDHRGSPKQKVLMNLIQ
jgi:hypothetical protein